MATFNTYDGSSDSSPDRKNNYSEPKPYQQNVDVAAEYHENSQDDSHHHLHRGLKAVSKIIDYLFPNRCCLKGYTLQKRCEMHLFSSTHVFKLLKLLLGLLVFPSQVHADSDVLKRQITMIAIGGAIGTGLIIGT